MPSWPSCRPVDIPVLPATPTTPEAQRLPRDGLGRLGPGHARRHGPAPGGAQRPARGALALRVSAGTAQLQGLPPEHLLIAARRRQLPVLARNLHRATPADKAAAQAALEQAQARFRALRC